MLGGLWPSYATPSWLAGVLQDLELEGSNFKPDWVDLGQAGSKALSEPPRKASSWSRIWSLSGEQIAAGLQQQCLIADFDCIFRMCN